MEDNQGKFQDRKNRNKKFIYSNMIYNKYITEHVESNIYFYVRRGIIQKKSQYCKVENCYKISSYGFCNRIDKYLDHRLRFMTNIRKKHILCKIHDISHSKKTKHVSYVKILKNIVMKIIVI